MKPFRGEDTVSQDEPEQLITFGALEHRFRPFGMLILLRIELLILCFLRHVLMWCCVTVTEKPSANVGYISNLAWHR